MKILWLALLLGSCLSFNWTTISPNASTQLSNSALSHYLTEMKSSFDWAPSVLFVKSERNDAQQLQKRIGNTQIVVKNKAQLLAYSLQHAGKTLLYISLDVEQENNNYIVYIVNEGLKTVLKEGAPSHQLIEAPLGRTCALRYDEQLHYQSIDCLLLPEDVE